jgi:hypothetical protein
MWQVDVLPPITSGGWGLFNFIDCRKRVALFIFFHGERRIFLAETLDRQRQANFFPHVKARISKHPKIENRIQSIRTRPTPPPPRPSYFTLYFHFLEEFSVGTGTRGRGNKFWRKPPTNQLLGINPEVEFIIKSSRAGLEG